MKYTEIQDLLKEHFQEVLAVRIRKLDENGPYSTEQIQDYASTLRCADAAIKEDQDEIYQYLDFGEGVIDPFGVEHMMKPIVEKHNIERNSTDYTTLKSEYKYAFKNFMRDLIDYSNQMRDYRLVTAAYKGPTEVTETCSKYLLEDIIKEFLEELKTTVKSNSFVEVESCLSYLTELLGSDFTIKELNGEKARYIKQCLLKTPKHRNKKIETKGLPLTQQIEYRGLETLTNATINKYLITFSSLFKWAKNNSYVTENYFSEMKVKDQKKGKKEPFSTEEISIMLDEISKKSDGLANNDTRYWGMLISIFTGARRGEVSALTPSDIKQDTKTGLWYFSITDEEEAKSIKTKAGIRIIPVHPYLIECGLLGYVSKASKIAAEVTPFDPRSRLLSKLSYNERSKWGRKHGTFANDIFLKGLNLKTDKKTLHSLRHSFITNLSAVGVSMTLNNDISGE